MREGVDKVSLFISIALCVCDDENSTAVALPWGNSGEVLCSNFLICLEFSGVTVLGVISL